MICDETCVCVGQPTGWRQANEDDIRSFLGMPPKNSNIVEANIIPWAERPLPSFGRSLKAAQAAMRKSRDEFKAAAKTRREAFMAFIDLNPNPDPNPTP